MDKRVREFYESLGYTDNAMYDYFKNHVTYVNMDGNNENMVFVGCFYNSDGDKLSKIHVVIPHGNDIKYLSQQVHEVAHFISLYPYLNNSFNDREFTSGSEIFPIAMERLFAEKSNDSGYMEWFNMYQRLLIEQSIKRNDTNHMIGFLNHWDYLEFYRDNGILPELISFSSNDSLDVAKELRKKINTSKQN